MYTEEEIETLITREAIKDYFSKEGKMIVYSDTSHVIVNDDEGILEEKEIVGIINCFKLNEESIVNACDIGDDVSPEVAFITQKLYNYQLNQKNAMDLSENYLDMCSYACDEFQDYWNIEIGDYCLDTGDILLIDSDERKDYAEEYESTWIPKQDQLINIVMNECKTDWFGAIGIVRDWVVNPSKKVKKAYPNISKNRGFETFEQTIMACIMEMFFGKIWVNGNWKDV